MLKQVLRVHRRSEQTAAFVLLLGYHTTARLMLLLGNGSGVGARLQQHSPAVGRRIVYSPSGKSCG